MADQDDELFPVYGSMADILNDMKIDLSSKKSETNSEHSDEMNKIFTDVEFVSTKPFSVLDQETDQLFIVKELIGYSSSSRQIPVYNATTQSVLDREQLCFSIKLVNCVDQKFDQSFFDLLQETEISSLIPGHNNIMGIDKQFESHNFFCVVFASIGLGSLRGITNTLFSDGLPFECVVVALKEALQGLCFIHENGQVHKQINAGHIFMSSKGEIKIGFSATVYDDNKSLNQPSCSPLLSPISICEWGAAPEVYNVENDDGLYTAKSDIWLIGMAALELAFGNRFRILNREAMDTMLRKSREDQKLYHYDLTGELEVDRVFSDEFQKMVIKCLYVDTETRPTSTELLESRIFRESIDVLCFHKLVIKVQKKSGIEV